MSWLKRLFGGTAKSSGVRMVTVRDPLVILGPRLGFLNLVGQAAASLVQQDRAQLGPLFSAVEESDSSVPVCNVLFLYARFEAGGAVAGSTAGLREITRDARASIIVVGWENAPENYIAAAKKTGYGQANLVLTLKRKGVVFPEFFRRLFSMMYEGKSMPVAWVELAPQIPGATHTDCPEAIFAAEISHIVFRKNASA